MDGRTDMASMLGQEFESPTTADIEVHCFGHAWTSEGGLCIRLVQIYQGTRLGSVLGGTGRMLGTQGAWMGAGTWPAC